MKTSLTGQLDYQDIIERTATHVKAKFYGEGSGHDWWHIDRVWRMARRIAEEEHADPVVVELAALLHDIADWKFHGGDELAGPDTAREFLNGLGADPVTVDHVCEIIKDVSFKGAAVPTPMKTLEGSIVQDADRLDAIGAIGIARAFAYGGYKGRELHNPEMKPELHSSFEQYKQQSGPTLNHFFEKLLLLKDRMNTRSGKRLAARRHEYMNAFVHEFLMEWDGKE